MIGVSEEARLEGDDGGLADQQPDRRRVERRRIHEVIKHHDNRRVTGHHGVRAGAHEAVVGDRADTPTLCLGQQREELVPSTVLRLVREVPVDHQGLHARHLVRLEFEVRQRPAALRLRVHDEAARRPSCAGSARRPRTRRCPPGARRTGARCAPRWPRRRSCCPPGTGHRSAWSRVTRAGVVCWSGADVELQPAKASSSDRGQRLGEAERGRRLGSGEDGPCSHRRSRSD